MQFRGNMQSLVLLLIGAMITQVSAMNLGGRPSTDQLSGCGNESLALGEDCAEGSNVKRSITDVSQYRPPEVEAIQWIKKWTVPNTRTASGNKWSTTSLPSALTVWNGYDSKIAPAAWAAAIVTRRSLSQGIFRLGLAKSWLNGMWGVQQNGVKTATDLAARAENIYQHVHPSESSYQAVLKNTLIVSGFPARSSVYKNVMRCIVTGQGKFVPANQLSSDCAGLVSTWLTRNHLVGLTLAINVKSDWLSKNLAEVGVLARYFDSKISNSGPKSAPASSLPCIEFCEPWPGNDDNKIVLSQRPVRCPKWLNKHPPGSNDWKSYYDQFWKERGKFHGCRDGLYISPDLKEEIVLFAMCDSSVDESNAHEKCIANLAPTASSGCVGDCPSPGVAAS